MADPVDVAVVRSGIVSLARELFDTFKRTAMLPHLYEAKDYSISVFDERRRLIADAPGLPEFVGSLSVAVEAMVAEVEAHAPLLPGDVLLANDPYVTGGHPADAALVAPAFLDGKVVGFCGMRAHMGDMGAVSNYPADARSVYEEGLVFPPIRIVEAGETDEKVLSIIAANSRLPRETVGNFRSGIATLQRGAEKLGRLAGRFGLETYRVSNDQVLDAAEHEVRALLEQIPDGDYRISDTLELAEPGGRLVPLEATIRIAGSEITVDLTGSADQQPGALNVPLPQTTAACRLALKRLTTQDSVTANAGEYRMLTVTAPAGCIFNAQRPAGTFVMATTASLLSEMIITALEGAAPGRGIADSGGHTTGLMAWMPDGPRGRPEIMDDLSLIGYGATPDADGMDAALHFCLAGMGLSSGEVMETRVNAIKRGMELITDSGGAGRHRGGLGTRVSWDFVTEASATVQAQRVNTAGGSGRGGGGPARGRNDVLVSGGEDERSLGMSGDEAILGGERIDIFGAGGGGYGNPHARPVEDVARDVLDEIVSVDAARSLYGVAFAADGSVDAAETERLRSADRARD